MKVKNQKKNIRFSWYCKYKLNFRKRHKDELCPEEHNCKSKECSLRHQKACKYLFIEGVCRFGEGCSYSHEKVNNKDQKGKEIIKKT